MEHKTCNCIPCNMKQIFKIGKQKQTPPKISEAIDKHFWEF